ncbi:MAG: pyridoxal-phosphate dependent enzyme, partial [Planctomycetota bacterium]
MQVYNSMLELIGNTPIVKLNKITKGLNRTILVKLEYFNPSGSIKDRIALFMLEEAERKGKLKKGKKVVEPTSGNTGIAIALVCAVKGYKATAVMPEVMSEERISILTKLGADVVLTPCKFGKKGSITPDDIKACLAKAKEIAEKRPNVFVPDQFSNPDDVKAHRISTAVEIWKQTKGKLNAFVAAVGTGGTVTGVGEFMKKKNPKIKIVAVEPKNCAVLSGGKPGPHKIHGIGEGFIPEVMRCDICDEVVCVSDNEAIKMSKRLAKEEG